MDSTVVPSRRLPREEGKYAGEKMEKRVETSDSILYDALLPRGGFVSVVRPSEERKDG